MDVPDFSRKLLDSLPNWTDSEELNFHYLAVQQIIIGTFFSAKEGPHRLEVRKYPVIIGEFLLDFSRLPMTNVYFVVKYWVVKIKHEKYKKEKTILGKNQDLMIHSLRKKKVWHAQLFLLVTKQVYQFK